ncbi:MAG: DUF167 domain-containing protein [Sphingomicrobium sp.]
MGQIAIRVTPRSARPGIGGWREGADGRPELEIRVAESPTEGAANEAVVKLLAKALRLSRAQVAITSGQASRHKRVSVPLESGEVRERLGGEQGKD